MESHIEQEESDSSRQSADLRIRKTQVDIRSVFVVVFCVACSCSSFLFACVSFLFPKIRRLFKQNKKKASVFCGFIYILVGCLRRKKIHNVPSVSLRFVHFVFKTKN